MYTMLMDERRSSDGNLFVFAGVIVRTADLAAIRTELRAAAITFAGSANEQLKYSPASGSAQDLYCRANGIKSGQAKDAVLGALARRPKPDGVLVVGIVADPRGAGRTSEPEAYRWGYEMALQRYSRFLMEQSVDRGEGGPNEVIVDTLTAEPHSFHALYNSAYAHGWDLQWPIPPMSKLNVRDTLLTSVARHTPALWLPDHVAGAIDDWIRVEGQVDAAAAGTGRGPRAGAEAYARQRIGALVPNFRRMRPGYSIAVWPREAIPNELLVKWIMRVRNGIAGVAGSTSSV